ncbi:MAG: excinuclease ABC subunit UvrA, partial [Pseudomonadota bacterium]
FRNKKAAILAPRISGRKGFHKDLLARALKDGYSTARIDGALTPLKKDLSLSRYHEHTIELLVGELPSTFPAPLIRQALDEGRGALIIMDSRGHDEIFSLRGLCPACGTGVQEMDPRLFSFNSTQGACPECDGLGILDSSKAGHEKTCPQCRGSRLNAEALAVTVKDHTLWDLVRMSGAGLLETLKALPFSSEEKPLSDQIMPEILSRLTFLNRLGLSYLSLSRSGDTLSGGEAQRIRLAAQLGSNLTGVCYILDEPTIGLHARDNTLLIEAIRGLKARGNSVLVVEHDEETILSADHIIDLGPGAGKGGGRVVATGRIEDIKKVPHSMTGAFFRDRPRRMTSRLRPYKESALLRIRGAVENNLKGIDVTFPLGTLICITGVSGSGKSTLLKETLYKGVRNRLLKKRHSEAGKCKDIEGWEALDRILEVDHSPIGRTPRSVPASYVGFLSEIRKLLAMTPRARARGYGPGRFSFNVKDGRCESCKGQGSLKVEMSFLPDVYIDCEVCSGRRFNEETLDITFKGKNISEILTLTFEEAALFFSSVPALRRALQVVCDTGLGYLRLGQPSPTLSGGEAQRIKLARELARPSQGRSLYILDEPTTGLHTADVRRLVTVLQAIVDQGNTLAVIEHNMEIIKEADYIIDLGPEGGDAGGELVTAGSPIEILRNPNGSHTALYLRKVLDT